MSIDESYEVIFADECIKEIDKVYEYIKKNLYAKDAAKKLMNKIEKLTNNLAFTPKMYVEIERYKETKRVYRRIIIDSYVLLYTIDEKKKQVYVAHMYYSGMDYLSNIF